MFRKVTDAYFAPGFPGKTFHGFGCGIKKEDVL